MSRLPAVKRRRLSPPGEDESTGTKDRQPEFYENASKWNLEQDYEQRARKLNKKDKKNARLPIKTAEGRVEQAASPEPIPEAEDADSFMGSGDEEAEGEAEEEEVEEEALAPQISPREQILTAKEELARMASMVSEDPEEHIGQLKGLAQLASSPNMTVKKLALATQLAVYKDIIPGYRIRPVSEEELRQKLSKDVRKLRNFEQGLVGGYRDYVHSLGKAAKWSTPDADEAHRGVASVAISCACTLINAVPHFNFRGEILGLMVTKLSTKNLDQDFWKCRDALETLFQNDEDGNASLEAVTLLTKMMRTKSYLIHESVLNTFLHLRLLSEFIHKGSRTGIDRAEDDSLQAGKKAKEKREFRTKKLRKVMKERKVVEKEMQEADATVSHEERDKNQAEMLKLVFIAYFRILKARSPSLMGAVLEGLARYAHLINQDFFGDILEALRELVTDAETRAQEATTGPEEEETTATRDVNRESLLCIITAFALLQGQDAAKSAAGLHLDLNFFITHLYQTLLPASMNPDIELGAKSLRLADPDDATATAAMASRKDHKVNVQTTIVLLLRSLSSVLQPPMNVRAVPPLRLAAFTKQLLTASLHLPEKSVLAMTGLLKQVVKVHGTKIAALWYTEERKGDGTFDPLREEVEGSNPFAATVWEGELLKKHYCPAVREGFVGLEKMVVKSRS